MKKRFRMKVQDEGAALEYENEKRHVLPSAYCDEGGTVHLFPRYLLGDKRRTT